MVMYNGVRTAVVPQMETLIPLLKESLDAGKSVRFSPNGVSMLPMIRQGIDSVVLSPVTGRLNKYDLPLYQRNDGKYVLHRIVKVGECYTCIGDNQLAIEPGIRQDQILAVVTAFYRGEKQYSVKNPVYWLYCRLWHGLRCLRWFFRRARGWLKRHFLK